MTEEQRKIMEAKLDLILSELAAVKLTQQKLERAVFGDPATKAKPLRDEIHELNEKLEVVTNWIDRLKWTAAGISLTNFGAAILALIGLKP